ncbi:MAG: hypothetical protein HONBIEJF_00122 [Fimbriimonadaceae bacterium]|nr:hypothetical protein [Fimbriimonadaceae bacterium]
MGGRVIDLAVFEKEPRIFYIATAGGGLWKTENGGITVTPVFDREKHVSIGSAAVRQDDPNVVWVGTGEESSRNSTQWGGGVYRSEDGGKTWQMLGLEKTRHISKVILHPKDKNVAWVAALGHLWGYNPDRGVFKTTDGGKTWQKTLFIDEKTGIADMAIDPNDPNVLIAAAWEKVRRPYTFISGGPGSGVYRSTDGGKTWKKANKGLPENTPLGRIGLSFFRKNSNVVIATVEAKGGGIFKSKDKGQSWTKLSNLNPRPFYFSKPLQDPSDETRIYVVATNFHVSTDSGATFRNLPMNIHVDHHAIWVNPNDSNHLIIGNDGGVAQSRDRGLAWEHINNMPLGQFYAIAFDMRKPYWVYGGLQDNGSWAGPTQTSKGGVTYLDWYGIGGGDGFHVQVDPTDWTTAYSESQGGAISRLDQVRGDFRFIRPRPPQGERYRFNWSSPFIISPHNPRTLYFGGNKLFKTVDRGDNWKVISPDLTSNDPKKQRPGEGSVSPENTGAEAHCTIVTISESPRKAGVVWVGTDDGYVWVTQDDGNKWTDVTMNIPGLPTNTWCSRVTASKHVEGRAYATFDGHRNDDYKPYVYVTEDFGKTWTSLSAGLEEDECCYVIKEGEKNPDLLVLGTELCLCFSLDRGKTWARYRSGNFPTIAVHDVAIHPRDQDLIIGTHGRSIWTLPIAPLEALTAEALGKDAVLCPPQPVYLLGRIAGQDWMGDRTFMARNTQPGTTIFYYIKADQTGEAVVTITNALGEQVAELKGPAKAGLHGLPWTARGRGRVKPGELKVTLKVGGQELSQPLVIEDATIN